MDSGLVGWAWALCDGLEPWEVASGLRPQGVGLYVETHSLLVKDVNSDDQSCLNRIQCIGNLVGTKVKRQGPVVEKAVSVFTTHR